MICVRVHRVQPRPNCPTVSWLKTTPDIQIFMTLILVPLISIWLWWVAVTYYAMLSFQLKGLTKCTLLFLLGSLVNRWYAVEHFSCLLSFRYRSLLRFTPFWKFTSNLPHITKHLIELGYRPKSVVSRDLLPPTSGAETVLPPSQSVRVYAWVPSTGSLAGRAECTTLPTFYEAFIVKCSSALLTAHRCHD